MRRTHWEVVLACGGIRRLRGYKGLGACALLPDHHVAQATLNTSRWYFMDGDRDDEFAR